jgi:hypothetical protein
VDEGQDLYRYSSALVSLSLSTVYGGSSTFRVLLATFILMVCVSIPI